MTQPTIKKYRRRVSDERVHRIAEELDMTPRNVRAVLEADAKVIEGYIRELEHFAYEGIIIYTDTGFTNTMCATMKQFHAEWEEIG